MKIIIGAGGTAQDGWVSTEISQLDIRCRDDFVRLLGDEKVEAFFAEHVFEHMHIEEIQIALANIYEFLQTGGNLRIAVPDGYHPDEAYIEWVRPGGTGPGCDDHKQLFNCDTLTELLREAGFAYLLVEWWDNEGHFYTIYNAVSEIDNGIVSRSYLHDERNADGQAHYTSLIVDAWKKT